MIFQQMIFQQISATQQLISACWQVIATLESLLAVYFPVAQVRRPGDSSLGCSRKKIKNTLMLHPRFMIAVSIVSSCFPYAGSCDCFGVLHRGKVCCPKNAGQQNRAKTTGQRNLTKTGKPIHFFRRGPQTIKFKIAVLHNSKDKKGLHTRDPNSIYCDCFGVVSVQPRLCNMWAGGRKLDWRNPRKASCWVSRLSSSKPKGQFKMHTYFWMAAQQKFPNSSLSL